MTIQPTSAAPAKPITPEEREQRFAAIRERMGRSLLEVTPPAGKTGYWVMKDDSAEIFRLSALGGNIVHDKPVPNNAWKAGGYQADGTYVIGDVILMEFDSDMYAFIQQEYVNRHEQMMANTRANFEGSAEGQGVPVFDKGEQLRGGKAVTGVTKPKD